MYQLVVPSFIWQIETWGEHKKYNTEKYIKLWILLMFAIQDRGLYAITNLRRNRN